MTTILLLLLSLTFHSVHSVAPQGSFAIMGSVRSDDNRPVDSIRVTLMNEDYQIMKVVFTDGSGRYRFPPVSSGVYLVKVMPVGSPYEETSQRLDLQAMRVLGGGGGSGGGSTPSPSGGGGGSQEPTLVDFVLKRKKAGIGNLANEVLFAQNIPDAARAEYKRGSERLKDNPDEAIGALKKAVEIFPDYYLALELLGTEYVKRGQFEAALPILTHALEVNHAAPKSLYALGVAYLKLKRPAQAIPWLQKAAERDGDNINTHMMLGLAYGYNNSLKESEASLKKAYQLGGVEASEAHLYLAGIYNKQEKYAEAVKELELYLQEASNKDTDQAKIKEMIKKLKEKKKAKG